MSRTSSRASNYPSRNTRWEIVDQLLTTPDRAPGLVLVSFDIDGTLTLGEPPGPISLDMVRDAKRCGHVVGSSSDRTLREQRQIWEEAGIGVDFVGHKHDLQSIREQFECARLIHIGDTLVDQYYAGLAGFEFFHVDSLPLPRAKAWVY